MADRCPTDVKYEFHGMDMDIYKDFSPSEEYKMTEYQHGYQDGFLAGVISERSQAEPVKHGRWTADEETGDLRCSVCGHYTDEIQGEWGEVDEDLAGVLGVPVGTRYHASGRPSYCSRCGARMDGGEDD